MRYVKLLFLILYLPVAMACAQSKDVNPPGVSLSGPRTNVEIPKQPWQVRSAALWKTIKEVRAGDFTARKDLDAILTQFEMQPLARTPLENMDILGVYYVPKDGIEKALIVVSLNAALGWYDALRFGSESGRDEIANKDKLFLRAFLINGATMTDKFNGFLKANPDLVRKSVESGLLLAERAKNNIHYDVRWPTAFGLERVICAEGESCDLPTEMPADQWDKAWENAKQRVTTYYQVKITSFPVK